MSNVIMKLLELEINSFMAIGEEGVTFHFNDDIKTTIIVGENGAGKSQIYEALNFVLYNKPYRKINKGNLINAYTKKNAKVRAKFISDGKTFEVTRTIKPDSFTVVIDGVEQDAEIGLASQKRFESMLGFDESFYKRTIVLGTAEYVEFMNLPAGGKRNFVENTLMLTTISKMDIINKGKIKNLNQEFEIIDKEIYNLSVRAQELKKSDDQLHKMHQESIDSSKQRKIIAEQELATSKLKLEEYDVVLDGLVKPDETTKELINYPITDTSEYRKQVDVLNKEIGDLQTKINDISTEKRILRSEGSAKKGERDALEGSEVCPTCNQKLENHEAIIQRKNLLVEEMVQIVEKIKNLPSTEEFENKQAELRKEIELIQRKERDLISSEREKVDIENNKIRDHNANIKNALLEYNQKISRRNDLVENVSRNERNLENIENEIKKLNERVIVDNSEQIKKLNDERFELIEKNDKITEEIMNRTSVGKLLGDSGIRSDMINRYIPEFNKFMMEYLDKMGADYIFTIDSEFNEKILSMGRENFKYGSFSRGEQARIDLAILFSWRRVAEMVSGKRSSLLILDEVFDSATDEEGVKSIKRIIDDMGEGTNVIIISHKPHNKADFDRVIEVKKLGRFSNYTITDN